MRKQIVIALLLALSTTQAFGLVMPLSPVPPLPSSDYDRCIKLFEQVFAQFNVVAEDISNRDLAKLIFDLTELANLAVADVQCFVHPDNSMIFKKFSGSLFTSLPNVSNCRAAHLKRAFDFLAKSMNDFEHAKFDVAIQDLGDAAAEVIEAIICTV